MAELESLKELRKLANERIQDWERPLFARDEYKAIREIADEIQAEVDGRYMELPLDADGVPIRVGDVMRLYRGDLEEVEAVGNGRFWVLEGGSWLSLNASALRHYRPRTVEDVLREFAYKVCDLNVSDDAIAKYAAELQMKGGE